MNGCWGDCTGEAKTIGTRKDEWVSRKVGFLSALLHSNLSRAPRRCEKEAQNMA